MHSCLSLGIILNCNSFSSAGPEMSFCIQQKCMARSPAVRMPAAGFADPVAVAECPEQEQEQEQDLSETFQPTGKMIATYSKRVTLSELTLEAYIEVFDLLTKGTGKVVQPNQDARKFTVHDLRRIAKLSGISLNVHRTRKEVILEALVGMELLDPRSFATQDSVPHALSEEEMQEDLLALQWQD